eukprot:TRINITY_DN10629_c0_g1_i1.p1 TRINITY_DN10629_c0_g1~~TRINITY_DN10629_c0_g1_i1.p1  ORF type:complete len:288 (-),score=23.29 TRINITY_DN10629_c0_g1_i1:77-940(-)
MYFQSAYGTQINYETWVVDERNENQILMTHGLGLCKETLSPLIKKMLASNLNVGRITVMDLRGHGGSESSLYDTVWWVHASDVALFSRYLKTKYRGNLVGVGHSMGGAVFVMAQLLGAPFSRLVLYEPVIFLPKFQKLPPPTPADLALKRKAMFSSKEEIITYLKSKDTFKNWDDDAIQGYANHGFVLINEGQNKGLYTLKLSPQKEAELFDGGPKAGTDSKLHELPKVPTTVLYGSNSFWSPFAKPLSKVWDAKIVKLQDMDHFGPSVSPDVIIPFIKEICTFSKL